MTCIILQVWMLLWHWLNCIANNTQWQTYRKRHSALFSAKTRQEERRYFETRTREDTLRQGQNVTASSCGSISPSHVWCLALHPSTSAEAFKGCNLCTLSYIYPKYSAPFYYPACEMMDFIWSTPCLSWWNPGLSNLLVLMSWCPLSIVQQSHRKPYTASCSFPGLT